MIIHGILAAFGVFDNLIHEMNEITANDTRRENKKVNWEKTNPTNYQNRGLGSTIYMERWR